MTNPAALHQHTGTAMEIRAERVRTAPRQAEVEQQLGAILNNNDLSEQGLVLAGAESGRLGDMEERQPLLVGLASTSNAGATRRAPSSSCGPLHSKMAECRNKLRRPHCS